MSTLLKAPRVEAADVPTQSQANPSLRILKANEDTSIHKPSIEVLAYTDRQVDAAEALSRYTAYRHWGINE